MLGTTLITTTALVLGAVGGLGPAAPYRTAAPSSSVTVDRAGAVQVGKDLFAIDYDIVNATGQTLTLTGSSIDGQWNGTGPIDGRIIAPVSPRPSAWSSGSTIRTPRPSRTPSATPVRP